nr:hypothetical protein [Parafrankia discariae]
MVIGVSGGLDSTHALIVAAKACDRLGVPRTSILGYTMPGFATGADTRANAWAPMRALGIEAVEIDIRRRRRRLQRVGAGRVTYNVGDQMSHYAVNAGVPKTLRAVPHPVDGDHRRQFDEATCALLTAILGVEISPELVPAGEETGATQSTEDRIGPYELHDFFPFHIMRYGLPRSKVAFLVWHAWREADAGRWPAGFPAEGRHAYGLSTIVHWLEAFLTRFFHLLRHSAHRWCPRPLARLKRPGRRAGAVTAWLSRQAAHARDTGRAVRHIGTRSGSQDLWTPGWQCIQVWLPSGDGIGKMRSRRSVPAQMRRSARRSPTGLPSCGPAPGSRSCVARPRSSRTTSCRTAPPR